MGWGLYDYAVGFMVEDLGLRIKDSNINCQCVYVSTIG